MKAVTAKDRIALVSPGPRAIDHAGIWTGSDKHIWERDLEVKETTLLIVKGPRLQSVFLLTGVASVASVKGLFSTY